MSNYNAGGYNTGGGGGYGGGGYTGNAGGYGGQSNSFVPGYERKPAASLVGGVSGQQLYQQKGYGAGRGGAGYPPPGGPNF